MICVVIGKGTTDHFATKDQDSDSKAAHTEDEREGEDADAEAADDKSGE